jgi:GntR family transcriptional regulator/MocR family aminotransferase
MAKKARSAALLSLPLDDRSKAPLFRQLYEGMRGAVLSGQLGAGARLPATRTLACELGVSRNTVVNAYEQLLAEGYLVGRIGSGTYVAPTLPDDLLQARAQPAPPRRPVRTGRVLSRLGAILATAPRSVGIHDGRARPFCTGVPALDAFPGDVWMRLMKKYVQATPGELLDYGDPAGYGPLREAIAAYIRTARAVCCDADQVIVVSGTQQAVDLIARVLLDPGDTVWLEEPGYLGARGAFLGAGVRVLPVPVDAEGLNVAEAEGRHAGARLCYVTPSHQYPLGVTMSLARRLALLDWARRAGAWIVEDDYDSEFRYAGRPLASLQGLDRDQRVIYLGTFSKVLAPALRLGYLVAPADLVDAFVAARALTDHHSPSLPQAVLADFIREGYLARHIRRMRTLYAERQDALLKAARRELDGLLSVAPAEIGLHLLGWLPEGVDDREASRRAGVLGVEVPPLSAYRLKPGGRGGLLLGYAATPPRQIRDGVRRLATALQIRTPRG